MSYVTDTNECVLAIIINIKHLKNVPFVRLLCFKSQNFLGKVKTIKLYLKPITCVKLKYNYHSKIHS